MLIDNFARRLPWRVGYLEHILERTSRPRSKTKTG